MAKMIFINLPVADVAKATAFYEAIGCVKDETISKGPEASMLRWTDEIHFMVLNREHYGRFTPKPIADAHSTSAALYALAFDSRADVDAITDAAIAAGGKELHPAEDEGFMYSRAFADLDGNGFGPMWMDLDAAVAAMAQPGADA